MAKKRGSGEGSIFRYRNGWRGQLSLSNGRRLSFSGKTKKEVVEAIASARTDYSRGNYIFDSEMTVKEWVEIYMSGEMKRGVSAQSLKCYEGLFNKHLIPAFGSYKLQDLAKPLIEQKYIEIFQNKSEKNVKTYSINTYSQSTVRIAMIKFKKCLQLAVEANILLKNPHEGVRLPDLPPPKKIYAYSIEEHEKIVNFSKNNGPRYWLYYLLISTGMRFGEAAALT